MTCLVTGGAGFIGSHLCDKLIDLGHEVVCIDNFLTGNKRNIVQLLKNKHFTFIEDDILNIGNHTIGADHIFHLASPASPRWYQRYPIETLLVNGYATYLLLEMAKAQKAKFLFASTSEIYGDPKEHPQKESYWGNVNPVGVRSCYDEGKRYGEALTSSYVRTHAVDGRIIRIFNTYGPRMDVDDGRVVSNFIYQTLTHKPLSVYGSGQQTRSFCYVSDMVEAIIKAGMNEGLKGEVINIGNPQEITINQLADEIVQIIGTKGKFINTPLPQDDPTRRKPTIQKAKKLLSWKPQVSLHDGIKQTVNYFRKSYL